MAILIGMAALLALLIILLYERDRAVKRARRLLASKLSEIDEKDRLLASLTRDKKWLIREIHHRIKNNLQMMISLLNMQSEYLNNPTALAAIKESRERMETIAIIHKKLNQAEASGVDMQLYIKELVDAIKDCFAVQENIIFNLDIDPVYLDISQAVPVGLILNEGITNAVKYAYDKDETGIVTVALKLAGATQLELKIADHGKGLPGNVDPGSSNTLGLQLIQLFSEQLDGQLYFSGNKGLELIVTFESSEYNNSTHRE